MHRTGEQRPTRQDQRAFAQAMLNPEAPNAPLRTVAKRPGFRRQFWDRRGLAKAVTANTPSDHPLWRALVKTERKMAQLRARLVYLRAQRQWLRHQMSDARPGGTCAFLACPNPWVVERIDRQFTLWRVCDLHARQLWPELYG